MMRHAERFVARLKLIRKRKRTAAVQEAFGLVPGPNLSMLSMHVDRRP